MCQNYKTENIFYFRELTQLVSLGNSNVNDILMEMEFLNLKPPSNLPGV